MNIDKNHPRFASLRLREKLVWGIKNGLTSEAGLIAHGRGEAFDYLLGEKTHNFAKEAITAAACLLLLAKRPVISVNGNSAVLASREFIKLAKLIDGKIEVNLFHFSLNRVNKIEKFLKKVSPEFILEYGKNQKIVIPEIASNRAIVIGKGIGASDAVLIPLEDGDRCEALIRQAKKVIAVDLNPQSRTAKAATVTIVDNLVRSLPLLLEEIKRLRNEDIRILNKIISKYDNQKILSEAIATIRYDINK